MHADRQAAFLRRQGSALLPSASGYNPIGAQGAKLNQADFILTLMSVFWEEGRKDLEAFRAGCRGAAGWQAKSEEPLHRAVAGSDASRHGRAWPAPREVGGRLRRAARSRARDRRHDPARREAGFERLKKARTATLNVNRWHHFLSALPLAGYRSHRMVTSEQALLYTYAIYLVGVEDVGIEVGVMRQAAAEFFFMAAMTSRYALSGETRFEADLAALEKPNGGADFLARLRRLSDLKLTDDFWTITLPELLASSGGKTPARAAYQAALVVLDAKVLFSPMKVSAAIDPAVTGTKATVEEHHLFPKAYLTTLEITERKQVNQIANFALLEWPDNLKVGASAPQEYAPALDALLSPDDRFHHALPPEWWTLAYPTFLDQRRVRMASVVRAAWEKLRGNPQNAQEVPRLRS